MFPILEQAGFLKLKNQKLGTVRNYVNIAKIKHLTCFLCEHHCIRKRSSWNECCSNVRTNTLYLTCYILKVRMSGYIWKFHGDERVSLDFFALKSTAVLLWHLCSTPGMTTPFWEVLPSWGTKQLEEQKLVILTWSQECFFPFLPCVLLLALVLKCNLLCFDQPTIFIYLVTVRIFQDYVILNHKLHKSCCNILNSFLFGFFWEEPDSQWDGQPQHGSHNLPYQFSKLQTHFWIRVAYNLQFCKVLLLFWQTGDC